MAFDRDLFSDDFSLDLSDVNLETYFSANLFDASTTEVAVPQRLNSEQKVQPDPDSHLQPSPKNDIEAFNSTTSFLQQQLNANPANISVIPQDKERARNNLDKSTYFTVR